MAPKDNTMTSQQSANKNSGVQCTIRVSKAITAAEALLINRTKRDAQQSMSRRRGKIPK